jgi:hypothetical protein
MLPCNKHLPVHKKGLSGIPEGLFLWLIKNGVVSAGEFPVFPIPDNAIKWS